MLLILDCFLLILLSDGVLWGLSTALKYYKPQIFNREEKNLRKEF
jgi:hypothetical protein